MTPSSKTVPVIESNSNLLQGKPNGKPASKLLCEKYFTALAVLQSKFETGLGLKLLDAAGIDLKNNYTEPSRNVFILEMS